MKSTAKKIVAFVLCVIVTAVSVLALASCGASSDAFVIGISGPLTGGASQYGIGVKQGAELAAKEINENGGLFGHEFKIISYDDQHDSTRVADGYASMIEQGMQVSLGCVTSAPCAEFKALSKDDNVFFITPSASNDEIPSEKNGYQMCFADGNQGKAAALYVNEAYAGKTIGILYAAGDNYSVGIYNQFIANLDESVSYVDASFIDSDSAIDFSSQITTLKNCEFIFMPIYYTPASQFMVQANKVANSIVTYYGCDGLDGIDAIKGFDLSSIPQEVSYLSHFNSADTTEPAVSFINNYKSAYGETPSQFAAGAYDCVYAIYNAMKEIGEDKINVNISASELCDLLCAKFNGDFTFTGVTGKNMTWTKSSANGYGYVDKAATKYVVKSCDLDD